MHVPPNLLTNVFISLTTILPWESFPHSALILLYSQMVQIYVFRISPKSKGPDLDPIGQISIKDNRIPTWSTLVFCECALISPLPLRIADVIHYGVKKRNAVSYNSTNNWSSKSVRVSISSNTINAQGFDTFYIRKCSRGKVFF